MSLTHPIDPCSYVQAVIIGRLVDDLLAAGFAIDVNDNDADRETHLHRSRDKHAIMSAIFHHDLDSADYCLDCWAPDATLETENTYGMVRLIDGNGTSVISDYSTGLEQYVEGAMKLASNIEDGWSNDGYVVHRLRAIEKAARDLWIWQDVLHPEHDTMVEAWAERAMEENFTSAEVLGQLRAALTKALDTNI